MIDLRPGLRAWIDTAGLSPQVREAALALLAEIGGPGDGPTPDAAERLRALERENEAAFWREIETVTSDLSAKLAAGVPFEEVPEVGLMRALGFSPEESACRRTL